MKLLGLFKKTVTAVNSPIKGSKLARNNSINTHQAITEGFSDQELTEFYALAVKETFEPGHVICHENDKPDTFHIILAGEAEVFISKMNDEGQVVNHMLATLSKDDVIGDMALVENKPRSASVRAKTALTTLTFKMDAIKEKPGVCLLLTRNMANILSDRLRFNNQVTVKKMEESIKQAQARNVLGVFMVAMFWVISLYTLSLTKLIALNEHFRALHILSMGLIVFFTIVTIMAMRRTGLPLSRFGITWKDWPQQAIQGLIWTLPLMLLFLFIKAFFVYFTANPNHLHLISGIGEGMVDGQFSLRLYLTTMFLYAILCPVQELIVRGAFQSTFFNFLPGNELYRKWNAIILSNLVFASVHSHLSFGFAAVTFILGLFWGWLFHKQKSIVSVSASHVLLGVCVIYILGVKGIVAD